MKERKCCVCEGLVDKWKMYCGDCLIVSSRYSNILGRDGTQTIKEWDRRDFIKWYRKQKDECFYCHITEDQSRRYYKYLKERGYRTDEESTRGESFEVDRKDNMEGYTDKNCVLACYYCNNAKSDVFNEEQFRPIGQAIGSRIREALEDNDHGSGRCEVGLVVS